MITLCGFAVVRLPEFNFDEQGRGAFSRTAPQLGRIFYGGIDRMPWFDIDEEYYAGTLPPEIRGLREDIKKSANDLTGVQLSSTVEVGRALLQYSNRSRKGNELIGVICDKLAAMKSIRYEGDIAWVGYDIVSLGHWSLLADGLFWAPSYFARWHTYVNPQGLISDPSITDEYAQDYAIAAAKGAVEELPESVFGIHALRIGRIL